MTPAPSPRDFGLDLMRAVAIGLVVSSHMFNALRPLGLFGVELFFVLSGYLIGGILLKLVRPGRRFGPTEVLGFLRRRWYRTLPNYYLFLALHAVAWAVAGPQGPPSGAALYAVFLQNFAWDRVSDFFNISWSLCVEEWFYLLSAVLLAVACRFLPATRTGRIVAVGLTAGALAGAAIGLRFATADWFADPRSVVVLRLDSILYGVLMAALKSQYPGLWRWPLPFAVGGVSLVAAAVLAPADFPRREATVLTLIPVGLASLLPAFHAVPRPGGRVSGWVEAVSLWSYSIYLCHMLVYSMIRWIARYDDLGGAGRLAVKAATIVAVLIVSGLTYRYFERPTTDLRDRRDRPRPAGPPQ